MPARIYQFKIELVGVTPAIWRRRLKKGAGYIFEFLSERLQANIVSGPFYSLGNCIRPLLFTFTQNLIALRQAR